MYPYNMYPNSPGTMPVSNPWSNPNMMQQFQPPQPISVPQPTPWGGGAMSGAMSGAAMGSAFGPPGIAIGALLGYGGGAKK